MILTGKDDAAPAAGPGEGARMDDGPPLTRVVVVGADGVLGEFWADQWSVHLQDGGRTMKLFATGTGSRARERRATELAGDLVALDATTYGETGNG